MVGSIYWSFLKYVQSKIGSHTFEFITWNIKVKPVKTKRLYINKLRKYYFNLT